MSNNVIHDVADDSAIGDTDGSGGEGLCIDNYTTGVTASDNLVYRVSGSTQVQTGGATTSNPTPNTIQNDIFACGPKRIKLEGCSTGSARWKKN